MARDVKLAIVRHLLLMLILLPQCLYALTSFDEKAPIVTLNVGQVQGTIMKSFDGNKIYAYRGIPYAQPPVGELRFRPPQPLQPWKFEIFNANVDSFICPQKGISVFMSEDCLKLNVFTRDLNGLMPVIVYIHGGANVLGSGHSIYEAGPQYLLDQEVVFVAFNYRLGALGFLVTSTNQYKNVGNYGYLDQVMALEWVQKNIRNFGGDPDRVTLMGMSAGSMAVSLHLASSMSANLFHGAILMSGSATNHFHIDNLSWTRKLAKEVGCPIYDSFDMTECLRNVSWKTIVNACANWEPYRFVNMKWNYQIDSEFMKIHPSEVFLKGSFNRVPLLVTYTKNELDFTVYPHLEHPLLLHDINEHFELYAPELFLLNPDTDVEMMLNIKQFYLGYKRINEDDNIQKFGQIFSDSIIGHGVHRLVELARLHVDVYYARMDYEGERSLTVPSSNDESGNGVGHADDLQYVLPGLWYGQMMRNDSNDIFMMRRMTQWFAHFARHGTPGSGNTSTKWLPCDFNTTYLLRNGKTTQLGEFEYLDRYRIWDERFPTPDIVEDKVIPNGQSKVGVGIVFVVAISIAIFK